MLEQIISVPDLLGRDFPERWIESSVSESPYPAPKFHPLLGGEGRGEGERKPG